MPEVLMLNVPEMRYYVKEMIHWNILVMCDSWLVKQMGSVEEFASAVLTSCLLSNCNVQ